MFGLLELTMREPYGRVEDSFAAASRDVRTQGTSWASTMISFSQYLETSAPRSRTTDDGDEVGNDVMDTTCMSSACRVGFTWASLLDITLGPGNLVHIATQASTATSTTKSESVLNVIVILNFITFVPKIYRIGNNTCLNQAAQKAGLSRCRGP
jgi:hypothetical protein